MSPYDDQPDVQLAAPDADYIERQRNEQVDQVQDLIRSLGQTGGAIYPIFNVCCRGEGPPSC